MDGIDSSPGVCHYSWISLWNIVTSEIDSFIIDIFLFPETQGQSNHISWTG